MTSPLPAPLAAVEAMAHFVTFMSPGTFVPETTTKPMDAWDVARAVEMSAALVERYSARPYGFFFSTRASTATELDSRETDRSPHYFLGGKIETREEIEARNDPTEAILRANMRSNDIARVLVNTNSWKVTVPLRDEDVVLPYAPPAPGAEEKPA